MTLELVQPTSKPAAKKTSKKIATPAVATGARMRRKLTQQRSASYWVGGIALVLTALSLSHLAHGIMLVTGASTWEAWAMAIGVDLSFVILELSMLFTATDADREKVKPYVNTAIVGTLVFSAAFNAFAFSAQAQGPWFSAIAAALGVAIPALIYALTRVCATLYLGYTARTS